MISALMFSDGIASASSRAQTAVNTEQSIFVIKPYLPARLMQRTANCDAKAMPAAHRNSTQKPP